MNEQRIVDRLAQIGAALDWALSRGIRARAVSEGAQLQRSGSEIV